MNQVLFNWLLGIAGTALTGAMGWFFSAFLKLRDDVTNIKAALSMMSVSAARALHTHGDSHGLDYYLDQYLEHDADLSHADWQEFKALLTAIVDDRTKSPGERTGSAILLALCCHKLMEPLPPKQKFN